MEPYKAKKMPLEYNNSYELLSLLDDTIEKFGEYKGYLRNMACQRQFTAITVLLLRLRTGY